MGAINTLSGDLKQKAKKAGLLLFENVLGLIGVFLFALYVIVKDAIRGVFGFIIGAIGLYIYLGIIGVFLVYVLSWLLGKH